MAGLGSEGAREDEEDTAESLRLEGTKHQYKLCGKVEDTAYFQSNADELLRSDHRSGLRPSENEGKPN